ncbi:8-amino-7-oxononanoate synthase [Labilithrix luteola]|uniref:8-amino-7-oxononanoate synthase n=1 Tax=Labilithrix luteola TaxID=1391654 RepID=A0A0K1PTD7_9BACT|nr:8-amino-7-oxononanoate synthase [Labilithrix luteola]AKU96772.1 8-amino-7-oxononanoate synthase [Labilithrix luteola]
MHSPSSNPLAHLAEELAELQRQGLHRRPLEPRSPSDRSFCSNDYLGLAGNPSPPAPSGTGSSRLVAGERDEHQRLERALAEWLGMESALLFTSGYAANVGAVGALARPGDLLVSDALNHASLIDGARLSRARVAVTPHLDLGAIDRELANRTERRALVVVESYYSMDADSPDLAALRAICDARGAALYVDDAHAIGVLGPSGRGLCAAAGIQPDILVGTLGKSLGSQGAFVTGRAVLRDWLWNRARTFVFSTGLAPTAAAAALKNLELIVRDPSLGHRVLFLTERLRTGLSGVLADLGRSDLRLLGFGHIVPLVVGEAQAAVTLAEHLKEDGIHVQAIRPPTVAPGTSRLRWTLSASHSDEDIDAAVASFRRALLDLARNA